MGFKIPRARLRTRIIAWSFVPTTIILLAVALVLFYAYQQVTEDLVVGRNQELTRLSAGQLATGLTDYVVALNALARTSDIYQNDPAAQAAALKRAGTRLIVFDAGVVLLNHRGQVTAAEPNRPEALGQDWSNRSYFRDILRSAAFSFSDIAPDGPGGIQVIALAVPVLSDSGEFRGTMVGMFRLGATTFSSFYAGIVKLRLGEGSSTYLVDSAGRVIYHPDAGRIGGDVHAQPVVQQVLRRQVGALRTRDIDNRDMLATFAPVPGTPWGLIDEESWTGLLESNRGYGQFLLLLLGLGVIVPAMVVTFGVKRITDPIAKLIAGAKEIAGGRFGQKIEVRTGDELEDLVTQFNRMSVELAESYRNLKEREERLALVIEGTNDGIWDWNLETGQVYFSHRWRAMLGYEDDEIANRFDEWQRLLHPDDLEQATAGLQAYLNGGIAAYELEHRLRHKDGSYRWMLARGIALRRADGTPYRMAGSHTDITELKQTQQALERRVAERTHELAALNAIAAVASRSLDLNEILGDTLDKILQVTGMEFGAAYRVEASPEDSTQRLTLRPMVYRGFSEELARYTSNLPYLGPVFDSAMEVALAGAPIVWRVEDAPRDPELSQALEQAGVRLIISVPLTSKGKLVGVINLGTRNPRAVAPEEVSLLAAVGQQIGVAVEHARLYDQAEQSAALAERSRLARELHDSVTQSLYSVTLYAEAAAILLDSGNDREAAQHLRELRDTAQEALREMRLLIFELRPPALEQSGLAAALRARLDAVETRGGMTTELQVEGEERLPLATQQELYHIAQEALNNVLRHAHAQRVCVRLHFSDHSASLEIGDDGVGFDSANPPRGGLGLAGMKERAERIGGKLEIMSTPQNGTRIRATWGEG